MSKETLSFVTPPAEKLQNFFGVFLQFQIGVDINQALELRDKENRDKSLESRESARSRTAHGRYQNVFLSDIELAELQADFPTVWQEYIERLSEYMASTGRTYKNHTATIRRWAAEDLRKANNIPSYSCEEGESL